MRGLLILPWISRAVTAGQASADTILAAAEEARAVQAAPPIRAGGPVLQLDISGVSAWYAGGGGVDAGTDGTGMAFKAVVAKAVRESAEEATSGIACTIPATVWHILGRVEAEGRRKTTAPATAAMEAPGS
ncbi:MAG: hypothetical protein WCL44_08255 [bacterium]